VVIFSGDGLSPLPQSHSSGDYYDLDIPVDGYPPESIGTITSGVGSPSRRPSTKSPDPRTPLPQQSSQHIIINHDVEGELEEDGLNDATEASKQFSRKLAKEINLVRTDPPAYAEIIRKERLGRFLDDSVYTLLNGDRIETREGRVQVEETVSFLKRMKVVPQAVMVSEFLEDAARDHAR
jgi:hypothetical protein